MRKILIIALFVSLAGVAFADNIDPYITLNNVASGNALTANPFPNVSQFGAVYLGANPLNYTNQLGGTINWLVIRETTPIAQMRVTDTSLYVCNNNASYFANCTVDFDDVQGIIYTFSGGPGILVGQSFQIVLGPYPDGTSAWATYDRTENPYFEITAGVPEPASMLLLGVGLFGMGLLKRRK